MDETGKGCAILEILKSKADDELDALLFVTMIRSNIGLNMNMRYLKTLAVFVGSIAEFPVNFFLETQLIQMT